MLEVLQRKAAPGAASLSASRSASHAPATSALVAGWRENLAIVNLRGNPDDPAFRQAVSDTLGVALPTQPCSSSESPFVRVVWVGPDDWFVIGPKGQAAALVSRLGEATRGQHVAITDVSGGYTVLHLSGTPAREVLARGCPLDLHPRVFKTGASAGSHFFKASVWLWQTEDAPVYEVLVRRSFMGYVWLMLERSTAECGLVTRRFA